MFLHLFIIIQSCMTSMLGCFYICILSSSLEWPQDWDVFTHMYFYPVLNVLETGMFLHMYIIIQSWMCLRLGCFYIYDHRTTLCKFIKKLSIYSKNLKPKQTKNHLKNHSKNQHANSAPLNIGCIWRILDKTH